MSAMDWISTGNTGNAMALGKRKRTGVGAKSSFNATPASSEPGPSDNVPAAPYSVHDKIYQMGLAHRRRNAAANPRPEKKAVVKRKDSESSSSDKAGALSEKSPNVINQIPCGVCNTYPKRFPELQLYENCDRCEHRTCFVCIRKCEAQVALGCSGRRICAKCCVEYGPEGIVCCLECKRIAEMLAEDNVVEQDENMED